MTNYIIGPISLTECYSAKYNKRIYFFGDKHIINPLCPPDATNKILIQDFLAQLVNSNKDKNFDLFLENKYLIDEVESIEYGNSFINLIHNKFKSCLSYNKNRCIYKNLRAHYVDIRKLDLFGWIHVFEDVLTGISTIKKVFNNKDSNKYNDRNIINELSYHGLTPEDVEDFGSSYEDKDKKSDLINKLSVNFMLGIDRHKKIQ